MSSILTNTGAMIALQSLQSINKNLGQVQSQISTGKEIGSAKDNAAIWAISKVMETDVSAFKVINNGLGVAESTVGVGIAGAERVNQLLNDMKALATGAAADGADYVKIQADMTKKMEAITSTVAGSQMNGINLLNTDIGNGGATFNVLASLDRTNGVAATTANEITVDGVDFEAQIAGATITTVADQASALTAIGEIEALIEIAINGAAALGSSAKNISDQREFVGQLADSLKSGIGSLVDADMEEASARLQALQTQQQLGVQSLSIANQAPQSILSLFR